MTRHVTACSSASSRPPLIRAIALPRRSVAVGRGRCNDSPVVDKPERTVDMRGRSGLTFRAAIRDNERAEEKVPMDADATPRAVPGSNITGDVAPRLAVDYADLLDDIKAAIAEASALPPTVEGPEDVATVSSQAVKLRDLKARAEAARVVEKEPHLRAGEVVDAFFKTPQERLEQVRRVLSVSVDSYKQMQLRAERERREQEAREARRREEEARRVREEAEAAARRARSPEAKEQREQDAAFARIDESIANEERERAQVATMLKSGE